MVPNSPGHHLACVAGKTAASEGHHAQVSETNGQPAILAVGRLLRILVNLSFLFDADHYPEHDR